MYLECPLPIYHEPLRDSLVNGKNKREKLNLEAEIVKIKTSRGSGDEVTEVDGISLL